MNATFGNFLNAVAEISGLIKDPSDIVTVKLPGNKRLSFNILKNYISFKQLGLVIRYDPNSETLFIHGTNGLSICVPEFDKNTSVYDFRNENIVNATEFIIDNVEMIKSGVLAH